MRIFEIGTGYTSIPANKGAATEIVVENLAKALTAQGHDVTIFDIADPHRLPACLPIHEVKLPRLLSFTDESLGIKHKLKRVLYSLALCRDLSVALRQAGGGERVVVHFHNQYNACFFFTFVRKVLRRKAFVAYTNHSYIWHDNWEVIRDTVKKRYFQEVKAMREADLCFVLNRQSVETFSDFLDIPPDRLVQIANGVDTDTYLPLAPAEIKAAKEGLDLSGKRVIVQVGSVCDRKNQLGALELLLPFMKEDASLTYLYVGGVIDDQYQAKIMNRAAEEGVEGQVVYGGEVTPGETLNRYYNVADAMVFPARAEGFSLVILEAMAAGLPVIVPRELKLDLRGCVVYSGQDDFRSLFASCVLDSAECDRMAKQARTTVESEYSWNAIAGEYVSSIQAHLSDNRS